jgi:hypothetical protein
MKPYSKDNLVKWLQVMFVCAGAALFVMFLGGCGAGVVEDEGVIDNQTFSSPEEAQDFMDSQESIPEELSLTYGKNKLSCYWKYNTYTSSCRWTIDCASFYPNKPRGRDMIGEKCKYCGGVPSGLCVPVQYVICGC